MIHMNTRRRRKKKKRLTPVLFFALLFFGVYLLWPSGGADSQALPSRPGENGQQISLLSRQVAPQPSGPPGFPVQLPLSEIIDTQYLKLVNRELAVHTPVDPARLVGAWPDMAVRATDILLHETAQQAIFALYQAAGQAGINNLFIASGYRSAQEQRGLYENATNRFYVLPPGHSEHQLGLAADILASGLYHTGGMRGSNEARFLAENAPRFGLVLRYPQHKQDITGVAYEPWHFRYVGRIHAHIMGQYDFVLEEYIPFLQGQGSYQTVWEGRSYTILYQRPENGMIFVPEGQNFWLSSTNTGGYILTAWT